MVALISTQMSISASSGWIKGASVVNCDGQNYGQHSDAHYH